MTDTSPHYVTTKAARDAIAGREAEIVRALGIRWPAGRRAHIDCPYPGHGGAADWRLTKTGQAICTCTDGKGDSVFDVAMKVEGLDFEAAKIRCVEIVGRTDLIRKRSKDGTFQKTDTDSLMSAPVDRREDALPRAYLAHRLGIKPAAVLMPATPVVGLRSLAYFDPPQGNAKPTKVGSYPCAVFIQVDARGQKHAHRIYLATAGVGKADLGVRADGKRRDPKKSARNVDDASTAGRAVLWGDPESAPWCVLAEGVETAAAVALAFRPEIERGDLYVAAGVTAGGVEAFTPWASTARVTVAADRDEAPSSNRPTPSRRGERAARGFGARHAGRLTIAIALPGDPDTKTDWLDIHTASGSEAVRAGILAAAAYTPTPGETAEVSRHSDARAELAQVARDYPLPDFDGLSLSYRRNKGGKVWVHQEIETGETTVMVPVASPFGVIARLRFADDGDRYGLRVVVQDMGGRVRTIDVDRAAFARQTASETRSMLFGAGLRTASDGEHVVVKCLKAADPDREIAVVDRPGWHRREDDEDPFYVCPDGRVFGVAEDDLELSANARVGGRVARGGTLEGWREAVAVAATTPRCEHWALGAIAGFCAPILSLSGLDTCGFNLSGVTSRGKTTAQRLAVSAWSRPARDQRGSLLQSARATANGVELIAARANGTVLAMDELGLVDGKSLARTIYLLASGAGKTRMGPDGQSRPSHTWSTFILLSAEKSLEEKIRADGGQWAGGMAVRVPDIDVSGIDTAVDLAVRTRIDAVDRNYGHAGPAFVEALIAAGLHRQGDDIRRGIEQTASVIAGAGAAGQTTRAALPFAILDTAGRLAQRLGILPPELDVGRTVRWAWARFTASTDAQALDPATQATTNLRAWIAERWGSSIHPTVPDEMGRLPVRDALGWYDEDAVYLPTRRLVEAAGGGLKEIEVAQALAAQGFIVKRHDATCLYASYVPKVGKVKVYALAREAFGRADQGNGLGVYRGMAA